MERLPISYAAPLTSRPQAVKKNEKKLFIFSLFFFFFFFLFFAECVMLHIMVRAKKRKRGLGTTLSHYVRTKIFPDERNNPWKTEAERERERERGRERERENCRLFWNRGQKIMEKVIVVQILKHFLVCSLTSETPLPPSLSPSLSHHFFDHPLTLRSRFLCSSHKCFSVTLYSLVFFLILSSFLPFSLTLFSHFSVPPSPNSLLTPLNFSRWS